MTTTINTAQTDAASLTQNEKTFLKLCLNYDTIEQQLGDNYSNGGIDEAMSLFDGAKQYKRQAAGGLLSSLQQKGMGELDTECDMFCLSERGIHAAFSA
jgi:hypothetical protein